MARRSVLLVVAVLIALVGTALIVLYVQGIDARATKGQELVEVLTATEVVNAGETVADAQAGGKFEKSEVRREDMVDGALSSTTSISDLVAIGTIFPGEQVIARRFGTLGDTESLIIPEDLVAVSVELTDPARVAGFVNPGSEVAIFVSGDPVLISPTGEERQLPTYTSLLLPKIQVIGVGTTSVTSRNTTEGDQQTIEEVAKTILTLAVDQEQAEKLIFSARNSELAFALLSADSKVSDNPGVTARDIMPDAFRAAQ